MRKTLTIVLTIIMIACFAGALSYPIQYLLEKQSNESDMDALRAMRSEAADSGESMTEESLETGTADDSEAEAQSGDAEETADSEATETQDISAEETAESSAEETQGEAAEGTAESEAAETQSETAEATSESGASEAQSETADFELSETAAESETEAPEADSTETAAEITLQTVFASETESGEATQTADSEEQTDAAPTPTPASESESVTPTPAAEEQTGEEGTEEEEAEATPTPEPTDRYYRVNTALSYPEKEKVTLDEELILPQYQEIYALNSDLVGWLTIDGTEIDYPVLQNEDNDYYLDKDFYGEKNANGQLILDSACDPYTPSYNLVISGHNMKSGKMFGTLKRYASESFWEEHKTFTFDTLMREGTYVVIAAFYSADYDVDEEGFRYNADIQYRLDTELWLEEVFENSLYDTGIDAEFGDEFLTLTTCTTGTGRFVVVARRVREGEVIDP